MRLLVTGGAGYIGRVVVRRLLDSGFDVTVLDNLSTGTSQLVPPRAALEVGDVSDAKLLRRVLPGIEAVMHFAASINVEASMRDPLGYFQQNVSATLVLLDEMQSHGVKKLVFSSTAAVYGTPHSNPVTEEHPKRPANPYGESKLMLENVLKWLHQCHQFRYATLRYFNAAGGLSGLSTINLIPKILEVALGKQSHLVVYGSDYPTRDGTAIRDYIHVEDLATAHILVLEALQEHSQLVYNVGNSKGFTVLEVVEAARKVTGHPIPLVFQARRRGDPSEVVASSEKIRKELGWRPQYCGLEAIMESSWEALRSSELRS